MGWLILAVAVAAVVLVVRARFWPLGPCPWCTRKGRGKSGRGAGSTSSAFNRCRHCGGSNERIRPLALIWPRHRAAASKRKRDLERARSRR